MVNTTATVGDIGDIISDIISLLPKAAQAAAACVSSKWSEIALLMLWRDLDSVVPLLGLLGPIERGNSVANSKAVFRSSLADAKWDRFRAYAKHVKSVKWNDKTELGILDDQIFAQIFYYRPDIGYLLPNLAKVTWIASDDITAAQLLTMVSPTLKSLRVHFNHNCTAATAQKILQIICTREVSLSTFHIETHFHVSRISTELILFLQSQNGLTRVGLPSYATAVRVIAALGQLHRLRDIYLTSWCFEEEEAGLDWAFEGVFRDLVTFEWTDTSLRRATQRLQGFLPPRLIRIHLSTYGDRLTNVDLEAFVSEVATQYLKAKTFQSLKPILECRELHTLEILNNEPLVLGEEDVIAMATAWPSIRRLHLAPEPTNPLTPGVGASITLLSTFALFFPASLAHLGIYIRPAQDEALDCFNNFTLPGLRTLAVGTSPVAVKDKFAYSVFLAGICPPGVVVKAGFGSRASEIHMFKITFG
ncbi:hypothetical protein FRB97_007687 [Tulasnella sp. 331]|nr:hypothetical protein FRB97_007687 [Tulasnella sp. 331]